MDRRGTSAYVAEWIGTFLLVLFVALVYTVHVRLRVGIEVVALVHLLALTLIVATLGGVSGAHVNPAVTIAMCAARRIAPVDAAIYVVVQLAGALLAVLAVKALIVDGSGDTANFGAVAINEQFLDRKALAGFFVELIGSFVLVWAYMGVVWRPQVSRQWAPLVIGGTLGLLVMCFAPMTGAGFNPARAFGPALVANEWGGAGAWLLAFVLGPIVGALAAAFSYKALVAAGRPTRAPEPCPVGPVKPGRESDARAPRPARARVPRGQSRPYSAQAGPRSKGRAPPAVRSTGRPGIPRRACGRVYLDFPGCAGASPSVAT